MGPFFVSKNVCKNEDEIAETYPWENSFRETENGYWLSEEVGG